MAPGTCSSSTSKATRSLTPGEIRGRDPRERVDITGYFYGDDLLGAPEEGRWVDYVFLNITTGR